jgi:hypothetical protein
MSCNLAKFSGLLVAFRIDMPPVVAQSQGLANARFVFKQAVFMVVFDPLCPTGDVKEAFDPWSLEFHVRLQIIPVQDQIPLLLLDYPAPWKAVFTEL